MRRVLAFAVLAGACLMARGQDKPAELKTISYADLGKVIRSHKGKVVVVDVWGSWCGPCKKKYPDFLAMQEKHAGKGLVSISLALEDLETPDKPALAFLTKVKSKVPNYRLAEGRDKGFSLLKVPSLPAMFVFDREGKRAGKFFNADPEKPFTREGDVEPLVVKLLGK